LKLRLLKSTIGGSNKRYIIATNKQKTVSENGAHISAYHLIILLGNKGNENRGLFLIGSIGL